MRNASPPSGLSPPSVHGLSPSNRARLSSNLRARPVAPQGAAGRLVALPTPWPPSHLPALPFRARSGPRERRSPSVQEFVTPDFGVTVLGSADGFTPNGTTAGFVLWMRGRGAALALRCPRPSADRCWRWSSRAPSLCAGVARRYIGRSACAFGALLAPQRCARLLAA